MRLDHYKSGNWCKTSGSGTIADITKVIDSDIVFKMCGQTIFLVFRYRLAQDSATRKVTGESPFLGVNYAAEAFGHIRVGDVIYAGRF